jgi:xanthine dehydrogenase accessory factor
MTPDRESVLELAQSWLAQGARVAWATVVGTWSSSPRPVGSQMLIASDGRFAGSVSGGCVESAVIAAALEAFDAALAASGQGSPFARVLKFGVSTEQAWEVGLPCGGSIEVWLSEAFAPVVEQLCAARRQRLGSVRVVDLASGEESVWEPNGGSLPSDAEGQRAVAAAARRERSELIELPGRRLFVHVLAPPLRLAVVGAVHLTQALADLAKLAGIDVTVIDPRTAFATAERFPGVTLMHDWPDVALEKLVLDARTAVVVLSHDAKLDEPALVAALRSDCFYIGALGSQRTQRARRGRLAEAGFDEAALDRIHGPVGLDIGAVTTTEIAISIMAEIIGQWRQRPVSPSSPSVAPRTA